ncbi:hypothetical protein EJB05_50019, partial [Eragrostis curvula]
MAEILATMAVGPLVSMVKEKASSYLLGQYKVMEGMEEQHEILMRKLPAILDVIADAEMQAAEHREGAKAWLEAIRKVAYQANDVVDEFKYEALRRKAKKEGHYRKLEMNAFRFKFRPQQQLSMKWRETDSNIVDPMEIASRSRANEKQKDITVVPIYGMGGLGKTTLAQLVYNDPKIREHFQLLLWVCVSDNFDVDLLAKNIVEAAGSVITDGKPPLHCLREVVSGKRYLLVLDDVWNRDASQWEKLKSSLQHGGMGSSVLTTTRDEEIAKLMGTTEAHKLQSLGESFIEEIIKTKAFSSKDVSSTDERVTMVAATALGSLLGTKPTVKEWKDVLSRSTICDQETGILPILKLSYNALPPQMRQCFSFCALFPKDYVIDVQMLIHLWMANGFIMEEKRGCPEIRGHFFQEVKEIPFYYLRYDILAGSKFRYCSRMTCKIHDLMHDVAQSAVGKECATIGTEPSKSEDFPYSTRHLFVPPEYKYTALKGFLEKSSVGLQTLLCSGYQFEELNYLSKCNSVRALTTRRYSSLKPKYLHHLRYLDLSRSGMEALPEDISILYHLQTLKLNGCDNLVQLPKGMKYMTALRHLYTHGCSKLKLMPPELGCLTSLQTLTSFVAGTADSSCCNLGELRLLDLGGHLEVHGLENVTESEAKAATLGDKERLTELILRWTTNRAAQHHDKVLEGLKPNHRIKVLRIDSYGGSTFLTWINTLQHMVELVLSNCNKLEKLPPLWRLPALRVLYMSGMENLHCLCEGDPPFIFEKLKELSLYELPNLKMWWDLNKVQGQDPMFPEVEKLSIVDCKELTALPRASVITESSGGVSTMWLSAFPALKELELYGLPTFRFEAAEGTVEEQITFPLLEKLIIKGCAELTTLPEAPKLSVLEAIGISQQILLHAARYIPSLSTLELSVDDGETALPEDHSLLKLMDDKEKWNKKSSLRVIYLSMCNFLFTHSSAPALWSCLVQLEELYILECNALVHWPENVFQLLVSLRKLSIDECNKLTGCTQASEQSTPEQSVLPPRLESLELRWCASLVEVPALPASLRELDIFACGKLESVVLRKQQNTRLGSGDGVLRQEKSAPIPAGSCSESAATPNVPEISDCSPAITTELWIHDCSNLQSLSVQLDCTGLFIVGCDRLKSLDDLPSLERLTLWVCKSLESIPSGPQAYSSLRYLSIESCPG